MMLKSKAKLYKKWAKYFLLLRPQTLSARRARRGKGEKKAKRRNPKNVLWLEICLHAARNALDVRQGRFPRSLWLRRRRRRRRWWRITQGNDKIYIYSAVHRRGSRPSESSVEKQKVVSESKNGSTHKEKQRLRPIPQRRRWREKTCTTQIPLGASIDRVTGGASALVISTGSAFISILITY